MKSDANQVVRRSVAASLLDLAMPLLDRRWPAAGVRQGNRHPLTIDMLTLIAQAVYEVPRCTRNAEGEIGLPVGW